jgi:hypothetical protein
MLPPQQPPYSGITRLLSEPIPLSIPSHGDKKLASAIATCLKEIQCWANLEDGREPLTAMIHFKNTLPGPSAPHSLDQALLNLVVCCIYAGFRLSDGSHHETVQHHHQVQLTKT